MNESRWEDLSIGLAARFDVTVTDMAMAAFSELSGDRNPLHVDDAFAQQCGFPGRVAFGLLTSSYYSTLVGMYLPGRWALLHGLDIELKAPVFPGDRLTVSGTITHLTDAYRRIEIGASIQNQNGKTVSKAKIRVGLHGQ